LVSWLGTDDGEIYCLGWNIPASLTYGVEH
jgi:hypothetical protein